MIQKAKEFAITQHHQTRHFYDGDKPYETHLKMVFECAQKYIHHIPDELQEYVLAAAWTHDLIEDCRITYRDLQEELGTEVAELTYALTNEKGKNRKERANAKYYAGFRYVEGAVFLKWCGRMWAILWSKKITIN